ncbi:MAG: DUF4864 domain-containing protein [Kiloniellales bacterium]
MRRVLVPLLLIWGFLAPAQADEADSQALRAVIQAQLEAFQRDDGTTAFSFASPMIQRQFGTPEQFMTMVRQGYDPVYRPISTEFQDAQFNAERAVQKVLFQDRSGQSWMAYYFMQQEADGSWRIAGVRLEQLPDLTT